MCLDCRRATAQPPQPKPRRPRYCSVCSVPVEHPAQVCEAHQGMRRHDCTSCGTSFIAGKWRTWCDDCLHAEEQRRAETQRQATLTVLEWTQCWCEQWVAQPGCTTCPEHRGQYKPRNLACIDCGVPFPTGQRWTRRCSHCREVRRTYVARKARRNKGGTHRARARRFGVKYEPVKLLRVFERDRWRCGICGKKVNRRLRYPHPRAASLDHVIPMSVGGGHLYSNVQCAHWDCNVAKAAGSAGEQLALI